MMKWLVFLILLAGTANAQTPYQITQGVAIYCASGITWIPCTSGGGGGGGGAVTVADGADVTLGAIADAAAAAGGTGTLSAKLRETTALLQSILTGPLPVTGTFFQAIQPVSSTDGADVTQGASADAAATAGGTGTVSAKLRETTALLNSILTGPLVINSSPSARTLVTLDVKTVTTGGTAVTAIASGHRTAGGFLQNPPTATVNLCINEIGTATGTTSSGDTTCIVPGQSYTVAATSGAVSVISSDSSHPFSGYGQQ